MEKCQDDNNKRVVLRDSTNIAWAKRVYNVHTRGQSCRVEGRGFDLSLGELFSGKQSTTAQVPLVVQL